MIEYLCGKLVAVSPGQAVLEVGAVGLSLETVSYTHLDVYKRQVQTIGSSFQ